MKFSYNWLRQMVDFEKSPKELAADLTLKSVEIEGLERFGGDYLDDVVVGEIKKIEPHPNADKLRVAMVDIGVAHSTLSPRRDLSGQTPLQVVCGAPNIEVGQKVPVAMVGCKLPGGEIRLSKIRGLESEGMICAEDELELGNDHTGIMVLSSDVEVGTKMSDLYNDWILDGDILPNRGDLQNHVGVAREISAVYDIPMSTDLCKMARIEDKKDEISKMLKVENRAGGNCPVYMARFIKGIKIGPSPIHIQQRLLACGMRPINNVVDITNYVMLEYGNPLHAFDWARIDADSTQSNADKGADKHEESSRRKRGQKKIIVRLSEKGESITTLDGESHDLPEGLLVIADSREPIAVAGVMGGANSEIDTDTTDIILESANFSSPAIRKSQRELGLRTEASSRFEKGLSPYLAELALDRAAKLFVELCGGELVEGKIIAGKLKDKKSIVSVDYQKIRDFVSVSATDQQIDRILDSLGFERSGEIVSAPLWREDIAIWQDIAEEIGRIYGLDKIPEDEPGTKITPDIKKSLYFDQSAKKYLTEIGLTEIYTTSIISKKFLADLGMEGYYHFEITNPLNEDESAMRAGLMPGLIKVAQENAKKKDRFSIFDLSKVYLPKNESKTPATEQRRLGMLVYGENANEGLYVLRKYLEDFSEKFGLGLEFENSKGLGFVHPGRCADIKSNGEKIGKIFELHPSVVKKLDLQSRLWLADLNLDVVIDSADGLDDRFEENKSDVRFREFSRFEVSKRDVSIIVDQSISSKDVIECIKSASPQIMTVDLFDEYQSDKFGKDKKSQAYHLVFQADDHTLTDEEIDGLFGEILKTLGEKVGAELRGL